MSDDKVISFADRKKRQEIEKSALGDPGMKPSDIMKIVMDAINNNEYTRISEMVILIADQDDPTGETGRRVMYSFAENQGIGGAVEIAKMLTWALDERLNFYVEEE
jgi:hypothetical protein